MKLILILLLITSPLYATTFREEKIDLGKGQHLEMVNLKHEFWVAKYETTQGEWLSVMGEPSPGSPLACLLHDPKLKGDRRPIHSIGLPWALAFCETVSEKTGRKIRLPTELEWEFFANGTKAEDAVHGIGLKESRRGPADVGTKAPNRFGLYDVLGNVMELCSGNWNDYVNKKTGNVWKGTPILMAGKGPWAPCRGGCYWFNSAQMMKVEFRDFGANQGMKIVPGVGFRVVCDGGGK